jgi:hypothetical protein
VLLHPVGSKVSCQAFDAHFDVLDLCLGYWPKHGAQQKQKCEFSCVHRFSLHLK